MRREQCSLVRGAVDDSPADVQHSLERIVDQARPPADLQTEHAAVVLDEQCVDSLAGRWNLNDHGILRGLLLGERATERRHAGFRDAPRFSARSTAHVYRIQRTGHHRRTVPAVLTGVDHGSADPVFTDAGGVRHQYWRTSYRAYASSPHGRHGEPLNSLRNIAGVSRAPLSTGVRFLRPFSRRR